MAVVYNLEIDQGADWFFNVTYEQPAGTPVDITDYTANFAMRATPQSATAVLELSTDGGGITIDGTEGIVQLHATSEQTAAIVEGTYFYDVIITSQLNLVTRLVQGQAFVSAEVTRSG